MRLLLDMGLAVRTARFLRDQGQDAVHLSEEKLHRLSDEKIVQKAAKEKRVLVTFDLDFSKIIALQRLSSPSTILFRIQHFDTDRINALLMSLLTRYQQELV